MGKRRQKSNCSKLFEQLPNEIIAEIFSYLNGFDVMFSFSKLNHHFQCLLFEYCQYFDFQSISKSQFDLVSQYHNKKQWKSLRISDDKHTPNFVEYFCQFYSLINDFPRLQSLSIINMSIYDDYTIFSQLPSLTNLISLTIGCVCGAKMSPFDLPNLKRLVFTSCADINWIKNFSQVEIIEYTINICESPAKYFIWPLKLKYLKINFRIKRDYDLILRSLDCLSSLISLELYQKQKGYFIPNGQLWENSIRSSLPLLKIFKFYFQFECHPFTAIHFQQLIASFSTPFYVNERKWFIQGNRYDTNRGIIFSIPFFIKRFTTSRNSISESISTFPKNINNDFHMNKYANVETLEIDHTDAEPDENFNQTKIINLIVNVDFDFVNWLSILTKLRHLEITPNVRISSNNFRRLLKTTSHLCSLSIEKTLLRTLTEDWSSVFICNYLSEKISILNLYYITYQSCSVSQNELRQIVRIFGSKCQHLSLSVRSPNDTITLILQNMSQLHSLHVHITATEYESSNMIWLEKQKTKFNNSNCRIINIMNDYYFWL